MRKGLLLKKSDECEKSVLRAEKWMDRTLNVNLPLIT